MPVVDSARRTTTLTAAYLAVTAALMALLGMVFQAASGWSRCT